MTSQLPWGWNIDLQPCGPFFLDSSVNFPLELPKYTKYTEPSDLTFFDGYCVRVVARIIRRARIALCIYCTEAFLLANVPRNLKKRVYKSEFQYFSLCDVITPWGSKMTSQLPWGWNIDFHTCRPVFLDSSVNFPLEISKNTKYTEQSDLTFFWRIMRTTTIQLSGYSDVPTITL